MKNTNALYPNTSWPALSPELRHRSVRQVTTEQERNGSPRTFPDAGSDQRSENNRAVFSPPSQESSQDGQQHPLLSDQDSLAKDPLSHQPDPETAIPLPGGSETLVSVQQFAQPQENFLAGDYQKRIAAYDQVGHLSPDPDNPAQILKPTQDGEEVEIEIYRRIDLSV